MNEITKLHREAMAFADQALAARRSGDLATADMLAREAWKLEATAAHQLEQNVDAEPSRAVLYRSAATLAAECREWREAERLITTALAGHPPPTLAAELQTLLAEVQAQIGVA